MSQQSGIGRDNQFERLSMILEVGSRALESGVCVCVCVWQCFSKEQRQVFEAIERTWCRKSTRMCAQEIKSVEQHFC